MKIIKLFGLSSFAANCYAVASEEGNVALIDAPCNAEKILSELEARGLTLKKILLTHGHFDHIMATGELVRKTNAEVFIHSLDRDKLRSPTLSVAEYFGISGFEPFYGEKAIEDNDKITLDELTFEVIHTPGHTSGGVCYKIGNVIFTGDTLFQMSVGRCDMPDGDWQALNDSLKKLTEITGNYTLYPGHGESTELDFEKAYNPYMR